MLIILCCLHGSYAGASAYPAVSRPTINHPLSYTEAWITISDRVEVKLRLFTDDLIRYDKRGKPLPESISANDFNQVLKRQTPEILKRIQLFVGGERLTGTLSSEPEQWSSSDVIDVVGSANLKHTWSFDFPIPDGPVDSLSIRHSFNPAGIDQPGELRLHSRHKPWKQRIDAVIPPELSYTIVYDEAGNSNAATATANQTTSRIIVSPFAITHEVTLPISIVLSAFKNPQSGPDSTNVPETNDGNAAPDILSINRQQQLGQQLDQWMLQHTTVSADDRTISKRMSAIQYFESGIIPEQPLPDKIANPISVPGTLVGIRQTYVRPANVGEGLLVLNSAFPGVSEIRCETIAGEAAKTSLQQTGSASSEQLVLHQWSTSVGESQSDSANILPSAVSQDLTSQQAKASDQRRWWLIIVGLALAFCAIVSFRWRHPSSMNTVASAAAVVIGFTMMFFGFNRQPVIIHQPETEAISDWITAALETMYQSPQSASEQETVQNLSRWLSDEMVESTYVTICQQMANESQQATWTGIEAVQLAGIAVEIEQPDSLWISCEWEVDGMAYHWGHAHQVIRSYSGVFLLARTDGEWKIQDVAQLQAAGSNFSR